MKQPKSLHGVKEIAKLSGVSIGTVDRVLHDRPGVAPKTKERVLAVLKEYNYSPSLIGRALSKKKRIQLGALIPVSSKESSYWEAPLKGIQQAEQELSKYQLSIQYFLYDQDNRKSFLDQVELIKQGQFQGLVLAPTFLKESRDLCTYCDQRGIIYSFLNSDLNNCQNVAYFGPDLFQSGYLAGRLVQLISKQTEKLLILHISKEMEEDHHVIRKEEGLKAYFAGQNLSKPIENLFINGTEYPYIQSKLEPVIQEYRPQVILVSNSRTSSVARYLKEKQLSGIRLIGFDFLDDNIQYLKDGWVDFLICHKPSKQGLNAVMSLFEKLLMDKTPQKVNFMPLDIICKENYSYYEN